MKVETKRQRYNKRLHALKTERSSWEGSWRDISDHIQPWRSRFCMSDSNKGNRHNKALVDDTPFKASRTLASGMMSGLTSPARPWFKLAIDNPELMESAAVKQWLYLVTQRMQSVMSKSNLYNQLHQLYGELGTFGTSCILIVEDKEDVIRAIPMTVGTYYLATSSRGMVDTIYREMRKTVRQLVQEFGLKNCSNSVQTMYDNDNLEAWVEVVHLIEPNDERNEGKLDSKNKPYRSVYYESGCTEDKLLRESGFDEFPGVAPRWEVLGDDVYGYGPGHAALGPSRSLQVMQKKKAQAVEKQINPPMNVPSSSKSKPFSLLPGSLNYYDAAMGGQQMAQPSQSVNLNLNSIMEDIVAHQTSIKETFYADLFMMIANDQRSNITAREIQERHEEKLLALGPVVERLDTEALDPMIDRVFGIMMRGGHLPPPPEEIQGVDLNVQYISVMAQAQKLVGIGAIERITSFVGNLAGADPSALDKLNIDQAIDQYSNSVSAPPDIIRTDDEVAEIRQARAQQQQQAQAMEMAQQAAQGAKLLSETDAGTGQNGLSAMMQQMGLA
uniref:Portal protein n=1 Tax=Ribes TaxID=3801 RepID=UPI0023BB1B5D|nr:Chain A, Portal protein [Ribes]